MGMSIEQFYNIEERQFFNISKGYKQKQLEAAQLSWEQTRAIMYAVHLSTPTDKKRKKVSIQEFMPFEWEQKQQKVKSRTPEEIKALHKKWDKVNFNKQY